MKNPVKALDKIGKAFKYLGGKFPKISEAKLKAFLMVYRVEMLEDMAFDTNLSALDSPAWAFFKAVCFPGNKKDPNYVNLVQNLLESY
jgi:hypothetical protein